MGNWYDAMRHSCLCIQLLEPYASQASFTQLLELYSEHTIVPKRVTLLQDPRAMGFSEMGHFKML